ncbi:N,N-dimethylformamidase beta subunit family domain-containing protein [Catellatospora sichuanensis]|uniref:N,N-dimethylformamidase beta subunit family domain-containing protein n=1 Tax=Catellatospora sichuanensis TaxID=1969805 RepID=UPI001C902BD6|nr:N,N-dimethylformamidase beta subunit family domain-containing protein [Catellatospora sichuanensis]
MSQFRRRALLAALATGLAGGTVWATGWPGIRFPGGRAAAGPAPAPASRKRKAVADDGWKMTSPGIRASSDKRLDITGYASATSVNVGERIDFHVSVADPGRYQVKVYRMGYYGTAGAGLATTSPMLDGVTQVVPAPQPGSGTIVCDWPASWGLTIPEDWMSGHYLAVLTREDGRRSYVPFVVRDDDRPAELCVVVPTTTYQAYNLWPKDQRKGKSLYYGYALKAATAGAPPTRGLDPDSRAVEVSFDRPYANAGRPANVELDWTFASWAEEAGYDLVYATSQDLHAGRIDPTRYAGLVFPGHDEYWSREMRQHATAAPAAGTSLVFLSANNVYWHVRLPEATDGRTGRLLTCYKSRGDEPGERADRTCRWRDEAGPGDPEQRLLGVQFNGIPVAPAPLVVRGQDHWFWAGTGVRDGDTIDDLVAGEADGVDPDLPDGPQQVLSSSPYFIVGGEIRMQNTSLIETANGALVFAAASLFWPRFLSPQGDPRIRRVTANLLDRVVANRRSPRA